MPFHEVIWEQELQTLSIEQLHSADYLIFGRVTYEGMAAHWSKAEGEIADLMNKTPKLVLSKDTYVFGSANLSETLANDNLFDEYQIGIAPVILGRRKAKSGTATQSGF